MSDPENQTRTDLWGNRVYAREGKKGRPPFEWTKENANKVSMLLSIGWNNDRIAQCILDPRTGKSISVPTLKRHFRAELQQREYARDRLTLKRFEQVFTAAETGNVGAMRYLGTLIEHNDMMLAEGRLSAKPEAKEKEEDRPRRLGKKELDREAAIDAEDSLALELEMEARGGRPN